MTRARYERPAVVRHQQDLVNQFGRGTGHKVLDRLDGVPIEDLVAQYGSPLFVFSEKTLRARARQLRSAFFARYPRVRFGWSYKTNFLDAVCGILHQEGWDAEVVSELEYAMARRLGIPGTRIVCNGAYKPRSWLERTVREGAYVQLDHIDELNLLEEIAAERPAGAPPIEVGLRVNQFIEALGAPWERFGFNLESGEALDAAVRVCTSRSLRLVGVHCHLGTFIQLPEAYGESARKLAELSLSIERFSGSPLERINLGGGLPSSNTLGVQYAEGEPPDFHAYAEAICSELRAAFEPRDPLPELLLESGRALVDDAGSLVTTVAGTRKLPTGERGVVLDAGINLLYTAHWYRHRVTPAQPVPGLVQATTLHGPLCMNIDALRAGLPLPPVQPGHRLVIQPVGAYNVTQWMQFSQPRPAVVMIAGDGSVHLVRRAEGLADVKGPESLPPRFAPPEFEPPEA